MHIPHSAPPHGNEQTVVSGNTTNPTKVLLLLHGRGATTNDILSITGHIELPEDVLVLAPQAANNTWYPERFILPQVLNQPDLDSAIERISVHITWVGSEFGIPPEHIVLAGFSQGACLVAEYLKRNPKQYLAAAIFSGGLIGEDAEVLNVNEGSLSGTSIYIGCDKEDFHIPCERVRMTADYFRDQKADVMLRLYSNLGHTIHGEGITFLEECFSKK